ncbi:MAG: AAA family ATPase [Bacillota bacterium]
MLTFKELKPQQLKKQHDFKELEFETTADIPPLEGILGQERASRAMDFGLKVERPGYNIYVAGLNGTGRSSYAKSIVQSLAKDKPVPLDWCYVYNFEDPDQPMALSMPAGVGTRLKEDMNRLIEHLKKEIPKAFSGEDYNKRKAKVIQDFQEKTSQLMEDLNKTAKEYGFEFKKSAGGFASVPLIDGRPISEEEYRNLDTETLKEIETRNEQLQMRAVEVFNGVKDLELKAQDAIKELDADIAMNSVGYGIGEMKAKYRECNCTEILDFFDGVQKDIIENVDDFKGKEESQETEIPWIAKGRKKDITFKYRINLLVDSSKLDHAPVIIETYPTYYNLVGKVEYENQLGVLTTNFTRIKAGALHRANGGYLIVQAKDVLSNSYSWEALKRALKTGEIAIENIAEQTGMVATSSLRPRPIPLDVKIIVIGSYEIYNLLYNLDEDFKKLFKVKADFDIEMDRDAEHIYRVAAFISKHCREQGLRHFDRSAVTRIVEYSSRLADHQNKLSTRFNEIVEIIYEADTWAGMEGAGYVTGDHVTKAIQEKVYRSNKYEKKIHEYIKDGTILIDTEGVVTGQVNGLSVLDLGEYSFGRPSRITAVAYAGKKGVINVEREVKMSGSIHDKGVLILGGYLGDKFAQRAPLSLTASIAFEQSYGGVDGDSASSTELYAILSTLADVPIKQGIAVTGSVNQRGEIQPIGGVNQKIEGFFRVCREKGLTGDQGVMMPHQNVDNLMLDDEVIAAVSEGRFHIYPVRTIEEGIQILTGMPAGTIGEDGSYPEGTLYHRVQQKLETFSKAVESADAANEV